ncbi:MAG: hypothetical protein JXB49_04415 [Bacteroidales bacterium]|nr:hypothetical protein [Bacteroidales bacterium]
MNKLPFCIISILLLVFSGSSCSKEPVSILSFEIKNEIHNADDLYVWCNMATAYKDKIAVYREFTIGYKLSDDFNFVCIDSCLTSTNFNTSCIEVTFLKNIGDSIYEYELLSGHVDLKLLKAKGELKGDFNFKLTNINDSTDILNIENGVFRAPLSYSNIELL